MNLRAIGMVAAAAAFLACTATTAVAAPGDEIYPPSQYCDITASPTQLQVGGTTTVTVSNGANTATTLTVTNSASEIVHSASGTTGADGKASFAVTLTTAGAYSVAATVGDSATCALSLTALPPEEAVLGTQDEDGDGTADDAELLAATGSETTAYLIGAAALVAAGAAGVAISRRRKLS